MKPNLLFLYTDEQRFDTLAAYGNDKIAMPNLNELAETAYVFDRAYVTQPVCTPARSSLLTGRYPHSNGCTALNIPLANDIPCLPELLPNGVYKTAHFGKWHLGDELFAQHGFEEWRAIEDGYNHYFREGRDREVISDYSRWLVQKGYEPENGRHFGREEAARLPEEVSKPAYLAEEASRFIRENRDSPFCLYVNFLEPHMPFTGPRDSQYEPSEVDIPSNHQCPPGPDNHFRSRLLHQHFGEGEHFGYYINEPESLRHLIAKYWGLCSQVDTHCGTILNALRDSGLWDDTIIVFTSDHGDMMGSHQLVAKCVMYEEAVRVPLLIKLPGQQEMKRVEGAVSQVDLVPTLLELMGVADIPPLDGSSLLPRMTGAGEKPTEGVVVEWNGPNCGLTSDNPNKPIDVPEKFLKGNSREAAIAGMLDPLRTIISADGRWKLTVSPELGQQELFDLRDDPGECENLFKDAKYKNVARALLEQLRTWKNRTVDETPLPDDF